MEDRAKEQAEFIEKYNKLCEEYDFYIGACGCCSSPWLVDGKNILPDVDHFGDD